MRTEEIQDAVAPLRQDLINHSLYNQLDSIENVNTFMEQHIFAVWDFMSLVKWLQNKITSTDIPWNPTRGNGKIKRFINEIVTAEESDYFHDGRVMSHYEMYIEAMKESGANSADAQTFFRAVNGKKDVVSYLRQTILPGKVGPFLESTFDLLQNGKAHEVAAAFTFGREDLIPDMFLSILKDMNKDGRLNSLIYYMERHVEIDGDEHGPMALEMVADLCGKNERKWEEAKIAAREALQSRIRLWNGIEETLAMKGQGVKILV
ncbi:DUF3050 domain-containing protein [Luteibaculum oceani]|uniref:DUF3050 domain-containing protein n=1 Tax=Luteibaculum oceani TaxID=1294296 RepID=A0A5C6VNJ2_9FLAO|nr:DUF3050 domain-containing protein [Luteibaculum oceani]TXC85115.1 DUF3050 domain-containing protein [Luteibaculum oceani]